MKNLVKNSCADQMFHGWAYRRRLISTASSQLQIRSFILSCQAEIAGYDGFFHVPSPRDEENENVCIDDYEEADCDMYEGKYAGWTIKKSGDAPLFSYFINSADASFRCQVIDLYKHKGIFNSDLLISLKPNVEINESYAYGNT